METGKHWHSGSEDSRNFERVISDQFRLNPTNSNLKKYIFRVGQPMSVPVRQTKRVNCNKKHGSQKTPAALRPSAFSVQSSAFDVQRSPFNQGGGERLGHGNIERRTPHAEPRKKIEHIRHCRARSCRIVQWGPHFGLGTFNRARFVL
jgi:hypothetical protein